MAHRNMPGGVKHPEVRKNPARDRQFLGGGFFTPYFHGMTDT